MGKEYGRGDGRGKSEASGLPSGDCLRRGDGVVQMLQAPGARVHGVEGVGKRPVLIRP